jgi:hypothetical protein
MCFNPFFLLEIQRHFNFKLTHLCHFLVTYIKIYLKLKGKKREGMFESVYPPVFGLTGRLDPSFKTVLESPCIHNQFVMLVDSYDITLVDSYE